jgi:hypothetical protein
MVTFTRTSKSLLPDRVVRVDRRLRIDDGMGGTYPKHQTIIQRYHVRLWPEQHQRRERVELGEQEAIQDYRAVADPTRNGKTVMIGDRFFDQKNNECYDVVAVKRPRPGLAYSAMIHYELRLVKDGCPDAAAGYGSATAGAGGTGNAGATGQPTQTLFIMRHFGGDEILTWPSLPYFDGAIFNLQYDDPAQLAALHAMVAAGRRWWRYYTILDYPFSGTAFGGLVAPLATWFNYLRDNIQFAGATSHRRFRVADTVALFNASPAGSPLQQRELIPWGLITGGERAAIVSQMVALADAPGGISIPAAGVFFDQSWLNLESFFVEDTLTNESGHGNVKEGSPKLTALDYAGTETVFGEGGSWNTHRAALMALYSEIATAFGQGRYAIKNGDHRTISGDTIPKPWIFENAWNNNIDGPNQPIRWAAAKAGFATDPRNILSIRCETQANAIVGVPEALAHWQETGGWISFTDDDSVAGIANRETAYLEAAAVLAALGVPS